jgi:CheY-like chemotaxis protein
MSSNEHKPNRHSDVSMTGIRICLVDDEDDFRSTMTAVLIGMGFVVTDYKSAPLALEALRERTFDCVVSDVGMPQMSGFEFFTIARSAGFTQPWLFMSGDSMYKEAIPQDASVAFLQKPFGARELAMAIHQLMV